MDMHRYEHILQPLRQLEEVWGIDLAGTLQSFVSEVAEVTIEMGGKALNFAEAAVLIMSASTIYSKKVDALHELVQETYALLLNKGQKEEGKDGGKRKRKRVVLRQPIKFTEEAARIARGSNLMRQDVAETLRLMISGQGVMGGRAYGKCTMRIAEGDLIPFEDTQSGGFNFRVDICTVSSDGLLLPNVCHELTGTNCDLDHVTPRRQRDGVAPPTTPMVDEKRRKADIDEKGFAKTLAEEMKKSIEEDEEKEEEELERREREAERKAQEEKERKEADEKKAQADEADGEDDEDDDGAVHGDDYDAIMGACNQDRFAVTLPDRPWEQLEIKEKTHAPDPMKAMLHDLLSDKMVVSQSEGLRRIDDSTGKLVWDDSRLGKIGPAVFDDLHEYHKEAKENLKRELHRERKRARLEGTKEDVDAAVAGPPVSAYIIPDADVDDEAHIIEDDNMSTEEDDMPVCLDPPHTASKTSDGAGDGDGEDGLPTCAELYDQAMEGASANDPEMSFYASLARYDDMLFASNLENTERQANLSREETELHHRIQKWQHRVEPLLEQQADRPPYDIYTYAARILDLFGDTKKYSFERIAGVCEGSWELSRYFLAMLQLTNNGNIHLDITPSRDGTRSDGIELHLITRENAFDFDAEEFSNVGLHVNRSENEMPSLPPAIRKAPMKKTGRRVVVQSPL
eukprot:Sspe_Gene.16175::Locus_5687_Transcript_1_1_Confidence_1.000_Length_2201::g.16175::m.16175